MRVTSPDEGRSPSTTYTGLRKNLFSLNWKRTPPVTSMADATDVHGERLPVDLDAPVAPASMPSRRRHGEAA
jgi:hypothetical protein